MNISVCDLCDLHEDSIQVADSIFRDFGGTLVFGGEIVTIKCFEDNSKVKEWVAKPGYGRVLVVDGGGSLRRSLLGDQLAAAAIKNNWAGLIINAAIRDVEVIKTLPLGVKALNTIPLKTEKRNLGDVNVPVNFAGVSFKPGEFVYADTNGVIASPSKLI